ncbi:Lytic transglycosylase SLT domain-containing protein [Desulfonema limicola]|uniref:Lytic transglycosylase SLT domain-containing protein n=2 Tax=Desulfonema limicola TaxID=45656 RepID=A0A975B468_9BACT|nr:Lytic transglycosylase SLT domain-containing protein [Desulfonema limicola]
MQASEMQSFFKYVKREGIMKTRYLILFFGLLCLLFPYPGRVCTAKADTSIEDIAAHVQEVGKQTGIPAYILMAVIKVESNFDENAVSEKQALGLMQVKRGTAVEVNVDPEKLFEPFHNILAGARYIKKQLERFNGSWALAFSAYYMGPEKIKNRSLLTEPELRGLVRHMKRLNKYIRHYADHTG